MKSIILHQLIFASVFNLIPKPFSHLDITKTILCFSKNIHQIYILSSLLEYEYSENKTK